MLFIVIGLQGESFESTTRTMRNILSTGKVLFRAAGDDSVKLTLVFCNNERDGQVRGKVSSTVRVIIMIIFFVVTQSILFYVSVSHGWNVQTVVKIL